MRIHFCQSSRIFESREGDIFMGLLFFILWIIFNGRITVEIVLLGIAVSGAVYAFCCRFLGYSVKKDLFLMTRAGYVLIFLGILIWEIIKANAATCKLILSPHNRVDPVVVRFRTGLKSRVAKVLLANSITLTPGTITVALEGDTYTVHCLDRKFGEGLENSIFEKYLARIEGSISGGNEFSNTL